MSSTLEYFEVVSTEPWGTEAYRRIASTIITEHNLLKILSRLRIFIDPKIPLFVATGVTRTVPRKVTVGDCAGTTAQEGKLVLAIGDETYLAPLITALWERFGKDSISQPDRFTIEIQVEDPESVLKETEAIEIADPTEGLYKDLIYSLQLICPEGFKVRKQSFHAGTFWFVASENTLPEDVQPLVDEQLAELGGGS